MASRTPAEQQMINTDDPLVARIVALRRLPLHIHAYAAPFAVAYGVWFYLWLIQNTIESSRAGVLGVVIIGLLQCMTVLACVWSVHIAALLTCRPAKDLKTADVALVVPQPNNGKALLVPITRQYVISKQHASQIGRRPDSVENSSRALPSKGTMHTWFVFQKVKFAFNDVTQQFERLPYPVNQPAKFYYGEAARGYSAEPGEQDVAEFDEARRSFGKNRLEMYYPSFGELMFERATAPFFVFQVFCVGVWCLDEYWYYSIFTLIMLVIFEATLVQQQRRNLGEIRKMGSDPYSVNVYRSRRWRLINSDELLPGDICSLARRFGNSEQSSQAVPADLLLLKGSCIVDESLLTGESVPQQKEPIDAMKPEEVVDEAQYGRLHFVYGGTRIMQHSASSSSAAGGGSSLYPSSVVNTLRAPDGGCICYVLRTGFSTSQGSLLRTIMYGVTRTTANTFETFCFILFLLIFAIAAAAYLWLEGMKDPARDKFKLMIECTLILTSVVPPELPIELSLAVNSSLLALTKLGVYCTEPFRIPFAGKVDICCFDKTGTLTSDKLVVRGVAGVLPSSEGKYDGAIADAEHADENQNSELSLDDLSSRLCSVLQVNAVTFQVLTACHSLVRLDDSSGGSGELVGDPLEKATLQALDWTVTKHDVVVPKRSAAASIVAASPAPKKLTSKNVGEQSVQQHGAIKVIQRFHFSSALKRMSCIASYQDAASASDGPNSAHYFCAVKGAPETLKPMYVAERLPPDYDEQYLSYTRRGFRVIALGHRVIGTGSPGLVRNMTREMVESELEFAGFLVLGCPMRPESGVVVQELRAASHHVKMITGDNALTACFVATQVGICQRPVLVFEPTRMLWEDVFGRITFDHEALCKASYSSRTTDSTPSFAKLYTEYCLCLTGDGLLRLQQQTADGFSQQRMVRDIVCKAEVFARLAPNQKEWVVNEMKAAGFITLMCGDGTNDVGALKHAHTGVALLQHSTMNKEKLKKEMSAVTGPSSSPPAGASTSLSIRQRQQLRAAAAAGRPTAPAAPPSGVMLAPDLQKRIRDRLSANAANGAAASAPQPKNFAELLEQLNEGEDVAIVKLGDASVAAPFTSKLASVRSVCDIIKQGRCTLVTTLQMFKILALNALVLAYSQSVLYLMGVKFSDGQITLQGFFLAGCFLFISRSQPLERLSRQRPLPNIFNLYTLLSVLGQFAVHFGILVYFVNVVKNYGAAGDSGLLASGLNNTNASDFLPSAGTGVLDIDNILPVASNRSEEVPHELNATSVDELLMLNLTETNGTNLTNSSLNSTAIDLPPEKREFKPNLLNTVVYIISMTLQVSTFLVNYRGRPFMASLSENRPLFWSIVTSLSILFMLATNMLPTELTESLSFVQIPAEISYTLASALLIDVCASTAIDRSLLRVFGEGRLKKL